MTALRCLITGADFCDVGENRWAHGDLFCLGENYIFNACLTSEGGADWTEGLPYAGSRALLCMDMEATFEKRGVLVASKAGCCLSAAAHAYLWTGRITL